MYLKVNRERLLGEVHLFYGILKMSVFTQPIHEANDFHEPADSSKGSSARRVRG